MRILIVAALLAGCATGGTAPSPDVPAGVRPGAVLVVLTSEVRWEPLSEEEARAPHRQAAIAFCQRASLENCKDRVVVGEPRDRFSRDAKESIHLFVTLGDLEPGRSYEIRTRWFGPDGGLAVRLAKRMVTPSPAIPGFRFNANFWLEAGTVRPGRWRVEIAVNGEVEAERVFEVVTAARVQAGRQA